MIVTDNTPKTPLKAAPQAGPSGPPPSYGASVQPPPVQHPTEQAFYQHVRTNNYRQSTAKRFLKAFFVALLIWILFSILVRSIVEVGIRGSHGGWLQIDGNDFPIPREIALTDCVTDWSSSQGPPNHAHASFELPVTSETLFWLSRGSQQSGSIEFLTSSNVTNVAKVDIIVEYYSDSILNHIKVCQVQRKAGERGVGFFTPRLWLGRSNAYDKVHFDVKVLLPEISSPPLKINNLETDLPHFRHKLSYAEGLVEFGTFSFQTSVMPIVAKALRALHQGSLRTSNAPITVQSFSAPEGTVRSSNGMIEGVYNATDSLTLQTSNAPIKATVNLHNEKAPVSTLVVRTSNNFIDNKINLLSSTSSTRQFDVSSRTSNGVLRDNIASLPVDATLKYDGRTSNSRSDLYLPPAFEGRFGLVTSNNKLSLLYDEDMKDPAGRRRTRTVHQTTNKAGFLEGRVSWDENPKDGHATVRSSNGPVTLHL